MANGLRNSSIHILGRARHQKALMAQTVRTSRSSLGRDSTHQHDTRRRQRLPGIDQPCLDFRDTKLPTPAAVTAPVKTASGMPSKCGINSVIPHLQCKESKCFLAPLSPAHTWSTGLTRSTSGQFASIYRVKPCRNPKELNRHQALPKLSLHFRSFSTITRMIDSNHATKH